MKYIITESRLLEIYNSYLDYAFDGIYEIAPKRPHNYHPKKRLWMKDDKVVLDLEPSGYIHIEFYIWRDFRNMFSLKEKEVVKIMGLWLENKLGLENLKPLQMFD